MWVTSLVVGNRFHNFAVMAEKVRLCWLALDLSTSPSSWLDCTVLLSNCTARIRRQRLIRWGIVWTWPLRKTITSTSQRCSRETTGGYAVASWIRWRARLWILSSLQRWMEALDSQANASYSRCGLTCVLQWERSPLGSRILAIWRRTETFREAFWQILLKCLSDFIPSSILIPKIEMWSYRGITSSFILSLSLIVALAAGERDISIACISSAAKFTCHNVPHYRTNSIFWVKCLATWKLSIWLYEVVRVQSSGQAAISRCCWSRLSVKIFQSTDPRINSWGIDAYTGYCCDVWSPVTSLRVLPVR